MADIDFGFIAKMLERWPGYTYLMQDGEIRDLIIQATQQEWSPDLFEARLRNTAYWRNTNEQARAWRQLEATDPASAARRINETKQTVGQLASMLGGSLDDANQGDIARKYLSMGWSDQTLRTHIAGMLKPGTAQMANVEGMASSYLLDITDEEAADYTRRLFTGELAEETLKSTFANRALAKFPTLAEAIKAGATPRDYMGDHIATISRNTDTPVGQVDLIRDPEWQRILQYNDGNTIRPMTIAETTRYVRGTDRFAESSTGKAETASFVDTLTKSLGARR